jgi:hypothetical protein
MDPTAPNSSYPMETTDLLKTAAELHNSRQSRKRSANQSHGIDDSAELDFLPVPKRRQVKYSFNESC